MSSFAVLAWAAGCGVDGELSFIPDDQFNGTGLAGASGVAGASGAPQAGASGASGGPGGAAGGVGGAAGGVGGAPGGAGSGGGPQFPVDCLACANTACAALTKACQQDPACVACVATPTPACSNKPNVLALSACLCGNCDDVCPVGPKCGAGGAGQGGGGAGGAGQGGAGQGGAGQGGAGQGGAGQGGGGAGQGGGAGSPTLGGACSPDGAVACNGHASSIVMKCVDSVWSSSKTCPSDQLCDTAAQPPACAPVVPACQGKKPGDAVCVGVDRVTCGIDLVTSTKVTCGSASLCQKGSGEKCAVCDDNEHVCSGAKLRVCKLDHSGFEDKQTCATDAECNPDAGACTNSVCVAGAFKCVGNDLQRCRADQSGYDKEATCPAGMCNQALGQCNTCTPGAESCVTGNSGAKCESDGKTQKTYVCNPGSPFCIGQGQCVQCKVAADCGVDTPCQTFACDAGLCKQNNKPNGALLSDPTPNDCASITCDGNGTVIPAYSPGDLPKDDGNPCTTPACTTSGANFDDLPDGTSCNNGSGVCSGGVCGSCQTGSPDSCIGDQSAKCVGGQYQLTPCPPAAPFCAGQGQCVACTTNGHCGPSTDCAAPFCQPNGLCDPGFKPSGTPLPQTPNDCQKRVCDGNGNVDTAFDPTDLPLDDFNPCTAQTCTASGPTYEPLSGPPCPGGVCTKGQCGACVEGAFGCGDDVTATTCQDGQWQVYRDCAAVAKVCRKGECMLPHASCDGASQACKVGVGLGEPCCNTVEMPGGNFYRGQNGSGADMMGIDDRYSGPDQASPEGPEAKASVAATLEADRFEVTVGRFRKFVEAYPYTPDPGDGRAAGLPGTGWSPDWSARLPATKAALISQLNCHAAHKTWTDTAGGNETRPINCVSWYVAEAFCLWDGGRLPFEAEWEFMAAGGAQDRKMPFVDLPVTCSHTNSSGCGGAVLAVGSAPAGVSPEGLVDLAGNLAEWTFDLSSAYPAGDCVGSGCINLPPLSGANFNASVRGGSFMSGKFFGRAAARTAMPSGTASEQVGFRCFRTPM